jgi:hypothetical protein
MFQLRGRCPQSGREAYSIYVERPVAGGNFCNYWNEPQAWRALGRQGLPPGLTLRSWGRKQRGDAVEPPKRE